MKSRTTEEDVKAVLDYVVGENYGSYYYGRVRSSYNVQAMERFLKLMTKIKGSDFLERNRIWEEMQGVLNSLKIEEQIEDVNTCEWVIQTLVESGAIKLARKEENKGSLDIVLPKRLRYLRRY